MTPGLSSTFATLPASFGQERLWFLHQFEPEKPTYNVPFALDLPGNLSSDVLRASFDDLVERHEVLRTTFQLEEGILLQAVHDRGHCAWEEIDLSTTAADQRGRLLDDLSNEFSTRPFSLTAGPLFRVCLVRLSPESARLLVSFHHIIFDGWSLDVVLHDLDLFYRARVAGSTATLDALPIQYGDYSSWQQDSIEEPEMQAQLAYWKAHLREVPPALELPGDFPPPQNRTSAGGEHFFSVPEALFGQVQELTRRDGVTLNAVLSSVFATLIARYTDREAFLLGMPVANRSRAETERLIGFFVNTAALRVSLANDRSVRSVIRSLQEDALAALSNGDYPFERLVQELQPERNDARSPLFQVMFSLSNRTKARSLFGYPSIEARLLGTGCAKFDLLLEMSESSDGLTGCLSYSADLFLPATIERMARHFVNLLAAAVEDPDQSALRLPMLDAAEREQILVEWNRTEQDYPAEASLASLFEVQAHRHADKVALVDGNTRLTYAELNALANRYAHDLAPLTPGTLIGLPAVRSPEFIAAILGILKAGGAYVPLSPDDPPHRRERLSAACSSVLDLVAPPTSKNVANLPCPSTGGDPAYVLYTSGSTGVPKGVVIPQRGVIRLVVNADYVPFTHLDVVAHASNLCFDAATFEIWGALLNGGTLVHTHSDSLLSPSALSEHLAKHRVTTLFLTTSLFNQLTESQPGMFRGLRHLVFGGEAADPVSIRRVLSQDPPERLVNGYGPTETTTFAVCHRCTEASDRVPIGRPIANTQAYILDARLQPVPVGVSGDLYIGGPGVALGYHQEPELTARRFIQTEFGRLYHTGDLARWLPSGEILYLGRRDHQLKIRGFRVEPAEIEKVLHTIPGIGSCAVVPVKAESGKQLVAYFTPNGTEPPSIASIREKIAQELPAWMVPNAFLRLEKLPLTSNGKLDVRALPSPVVNTGAVDLRGETTLHAQLTELWSDALGLTTIGIDDDFFELGGHSLLAARMLTAVENRLGRRVPFSVLFERATIAHLADYLVREQRRLSCESPLISVQPHGTKTPLFFLHGDFSGGGFYCRNLARHIGTDRPFYAIHPHGLHGEAPPRSIEAMAADRLATLRRVQARGPYLLGGFCNGAIVAFEMARQLEAAGEQVGAVILFGADGSNYRYRAVERFARFLSSTFGDDDSQRVTRFLAWRDRARALEDWGRAQMLRIRAATSDVMHIPRRILQLIGRSLTGSPPAAPTKAPARPPTELAPASIIEKAYLTAMHAYIPNPLGGRIVLLWPMGDPIPEGGRIAYGWDSVSRDVRIITVPGEHHSSIALDPNLRVVGEQIRIALNQIDR